MLLRFLLSGGRPLGSALLCAGFLLAQAAPGHAVVGGRPGAAQGTSHTVMLVSTRGASCSGTALAQDLILTAAHCVAPPGSYAVAITGSGPPRLIPALRIVVHPGFDPDQFRNRHPTPDLALVKLASPLPPSFRPAVLTQDNTLPQRGAEYLIAGYGMASDGADETAGTLRCTSLPTIGTTGGIMARLASPMSNAGACTGDSGGPAFVGNLLAGVIGWATGPNGARGCGGVTGITLVGLQRDWIEATARKLGSPVP